MRISVFRTVVILSLLLGSFLGGFVTPSKPVEALESYELYPPLIYEVSGTGAFVWNITKPDNEDSWRITLYDADFTLIEQITIRYLQHPTHPYMFVRQISPSLSEGVDVSDWDPYWVFQFDGESTLTLNDESGNWAEEYQFDIKYIGVSGENSDPIILTIISGDLTIDAPVIGEGDDDVGTHSDINAQTGYPDEVYDVLTEENTASGSTNMGTTTNTGSSYLSIGANAMGGQVFTAGATGAISTMYFYGLMTDAGGPHNVKGVICNENGTILGVSAPCSVTNSPATRTLTFSTPVPVVSGETYWLMVTSDYTNFRLYYVDTGGASKTDSSNSYSSPTDPTDASDGSYNFRTFYAVITNLNYELQLEEIWNMPSLEDPYLVVITGSYSIPSEVLNLEIWDGAEWDLLGEISESGATPFSILAYLNTTIKLRFHDGTTVNDPIQSFWEVDALIIYDEYEEPTDAGYVNVQVEGGGSVSPDGVVEMIYGVAQNFTMSANEGYILEQFYTKATGEGDWTEGPLENGTYPDPSIVTISHSGDINTTLLVYFISETAENYIINLRRFENGTVCNVTYTASIQLTSGYLYTQTVSTDETPVTYASSIWSFTYPLLDPDEYRTLYAPSSPITPFIPGSTSDQYLFTIQDLTGYLVGKVAYLEAWKTTGVNSYVVDSAVVNGTVNGFPLTLERGSVVTLKLLLPGNETRYSFGVFTPTGNPLTHTLIFNYLGFENTMHHINAYVSASSIRNGTEVDVIYANTLLGYDVEATAYVYLRNGTLVDSASSTLDADTINFSGLTASTDYVVKLEVEHEYFPTTIKKSWGFAGSWTPGATAFPDFTSMGWTVGGVSNLIGVGLILFVAGIFSFASAPLGIVVTVLVAGALGAVGIVSIPVDLLALAFSLAIIMAIGRREK